MTSQNASALPGTFRPSDAAIHQLIEAAADHPLGTEFLAAGALDAVAATFGAHAFTVEAAREELRRRPNGYRLDSSAEVVTMPAASSSART